MVLFGSSKKAFLGLILWIFNPYNLIINQMISSMDVIYTSFFVASIYLLLTKRFILSSIFYVFVSIARFIPLIFFPLLIFYLKKSRAMSKYTIGMVGTLICFFIPFALVYGTNLAKMIYSLPMEGPKYHAEFTGFFGHAFTSNINPENFISLVFYLYLFLVYFCYLYMGKNEFSFLESIFLISVLFTSFSMWHIYHSIWIIPFITIVYASRIKKNQLLDFLFISFFVTLYLQYRIFLPGIGAVYFPEFQNIVESIRELFDSIQPIISTLFRSLFVAVCITFILETIIQRHFEIKKLQLV